MDTRSYENRTIGLKSGKERLDIRLDTVRKLVQNPSVIKVPGAPLGVAGMMELDGELISLFFPGREPCSSACAVVIGRDDGGCYGILADEIDGGA